ncbi:UNVERIFIED_CONTAM: RNA polymerase sigma factor [Methylobacteriaceae bacterium AG10]|jgi:RNA polymerase sigma factor (sigma-70 family)|uniref:RNA polymerase sigma factor n=1 Tax=Methylorubrum podarium TaxID=200476 RepID=A0ABV1QG65_9HYPH|nr:RNA polymerase sigma factor [Methylobacteriaceae bacterium AG10]
MSASCAWAENRASADDAERSLDQLLRRYYGELNALAFARLRNRDAAADLVQDAIVRFLASCRNGGHGQGGVESPRYFLRAIVANLAIDVARQNRRRGPPVSLDDALHIADPAPLADRAVTARQEYALLRAALDDMPARWRQALLLNRIEGWSHARIGKHLGISSTMVGKDILAALRRCLAALARAG